jgi:hypothetical protein
VYNSDMEFLVRRKYISLQCGEVNLYEIIIPGAEQAETTYLFDQPVDRMPNVFPTVQLVSCWSNFFMGLKIIWLMRFCSKKSIA